MICSAKTLFRVAILALGLVCCAHTALGSVRLLTSNVDWTTSGSSVLFHLRFDNPDATPTLPVTGVLSPQAFGAFVPSAGGMRPFDVPAILPNEFFDVFVEIPLSELPANPPNIVPGGGSAGGPCPPGDHWDGNVDITWSGSGGSGEVHRHVGQLRVCPGAGCSLIHMITGCAAPTTWTVGVLCPGFHVTLLEEDRITPAPSPLPGGWTGYVCVTADATVGVPASCCFVIQFGCGGNVALVELCATTCNCGSTGPVPQPGTIEWNTLPDGATVRFHVRWTNPSSTAPTDPATGTMNSQEFGVFMPDVGTIGSFVVPAIAPASFFDVFTDVPLAKLPANPPTVGGPTAGDPCPHGRHWNGNVDLAWTAASGSGQANKHIGEIVVCPGNGQSMIHVRQLLCNTTTGMPWSIIGLCQGFSATLVNEDFTAAPNPVPPGWTGYIAISAFAGTPAPDTCCFQVTFSCDGVPAAINLCAITCNCNQGGVGPQPGDVDWTTLTGTGNVRFHVRWLNPSLTQPTEAATGHMGSQKFGAFMPEMGTIGDFTIPSLLPASFFDVFFDVPLTALPPTATKVLSGGGPSPTGAACPLDDHWDGNADVTWSGSGGAGTVNRHYGTILLNSNGGRSWIHVISGCTSPLGAWWAMNPVCNGFTAVLMNEDHTLAPNPLPAGWTGWLVLGAAGTPVGSTCCVSLTLHCAGSSATIRVCATTCDWGTLGVDPTAGDLAFGIRSVTPNPTSGAASVSFVLPQAGLARLEIFDVAGHRVRRVADGMYGAGAHRVVWDGRDARGRNATPGAYFVRLTTAQMSATHMVVLR